MAYLTGQNKIQSQSKSRRSTYNTLKRWKAHYASSKRSSTKVTIPMKSSTM